MYPLPQLNPSGTEPYYTRSVWPPCPPSIKPSGREPYYTRSVWHASECRCTQVRCTPHASINWTKSYRALLHQVSLTFGRMQMYPAQMYPLPQWHLVVQSPTTPGHVDPLPQWNLVLQSPTTPGQFDMWKNADIPRSDCNPPPSMETSGTEPYNTISVWPVEECRCTQVRCTPTNWT